MRDSGRGGRETRERAGETVGEGEGRERKWVEVGLKGMRSEGWRMIWTMR